MPVLPVGDQTPRLGDPIPGARFHFSTPNLPEGTLEVADFVGREAISQPFRFELNLLSRDPSVPFSDLIDQPATLAMGHGEETTYVHGIVADFEQGSPIGDFVRYRAVLVPRLWRLSLSFQSRVFQHLSVPEIVRKVLEGAGLGRDDFRFALEASYPPREYCTQYKETDLAFVSRLLEHEGIQFFFEHEGQREVLVMTDRRDENPAIGEEEAVSYRHTTGLVPAHAETVHEFVFREQMVSGRVILKDYNYETPEADVRGESQLNDAMPGVHYEYGPHATNRDEAGRLARVRNEEIDSRRRVGSGEGTSVRLRAGHRFTLEDHYRLDLNQPYLVTEVTHHGSQRGVVGMQAGEDPAMPYRNSFACIPAAVPYRPPRLTPQPRLPGIMTAKVQSIGGGYASLDDAGRYHIKLPFDLADAAGTKASKPVRLAQPYTGAGDAGFHLPSHPGTEMVFACVDGDVDRPLAIGAAPNPDTPSPVTSANPSQFVLRTTSENEFQIEDEHGRERVMLWSPYGRTRLALGHDGKNRGASLQTDESFLLQGNQGGFLYGGGGLILSAWPEGQDGATQLINQFTPIGTTLIGLAATRLSGGNLAFNSVLNVFKSINTIAGVGLNLASLAGSVIEANPELGVGQNVTDILNSLSQPGIFLTAMGGADIVTLGGTSILAGAGISLLSPLGVSMTSLDDISMITGRAISGYAREGGIELVSDQEDVKVTAKQKDIKLRSEGGNIALVTAKNDKNILLKTQNLIRQMGLKGIELETKEGNVSITATEKDVAIRGKEKVRIEADQEIELKCGQSSITLKKNGDITLKGLNVRVDAGKVVDLDAGGADLMLGADGSVSIANNLAYYDLTASGSAVVSAVNLELKAKALSTLKASLSKIG